MNATRQSTAIIRYRQRNFSTEKRLQSVSATKSLLKISFSEVGSYGNLPAKKSSEQGMWQRSPSLITRKLNSKISSSQYSSCAISERCDKKTRTNSIKLAACRRPNAKKRSCASERLPQRWKTASTVLRTENRSFYSQPSF